MKMGMGRNMEVEMPGHNKLTTRNFLYMYFFILRGQFSQASRYVVLGLCELCTVPCLCIRTLSQNTLYLSICGKNCSKTSLIAVALSLPPRARTMSSGNTTLASSDLGVGIDASGINPASAKTEEKRLPVNRRRALWDLRALVPLCMPRTLTALPFRRIP